MSKIDDRHTYLKGYVKMSCIYKQDCHQFSVHILNNIIKQKQGCLLMTITNEIFTETFIDYLNYIQRKALAIKLPFI